MLAVAMAAGETNRRPMPAMRARPGCWPSYRTLLAPTRLPRHNVDRVQRYFAALFALHLRLTVRVHRHFGVSPQQMGLAFGLNVTGFMIGSTLSARHSRRLSTRPRSATACGSARRAPACYIAALAFASRSTRRR